MLAAYADAGVSATAVGSVAADAGVSIAVGGQQHISGQAVNLTVLVLSQVTLTEGKVQRLQPSNVEALHLSIVQSLGLD